MATYTSYYNLTKPEGTERVNIAIINQNMDAIDTQMHKNAQSIIANHGGMAIPSNNNTHAAVSSGQYVYVYNHSSLAEGLYIAKSAISTNGALSLSNLTAVSNGGLNHVYSTLNSKLTTFTAIGATSGTSTNVEIQLPSNAMFTSSQPLFMIASFRGSTSNANEGYAILKIDNGVVYVTNKSGIQTLTNLSYNSTTKKLTFTSGTYVTFLVFGLAIS